MQFYIICILIQSIELHLHHSPWDTRPYSYGPAPGCVEGNTKNKPRMVGSYARGYTKWGECVTLHQSTVTSYECTVALGNYSSSLQIKDLGTKLQSFKCLKDYSTNEIESKIRACIGKTKFHKAYSDGHASLIYACKRIGTSKINYHEISVPGQPKSNAIIERENGLSHWQIRAALVTAGFPICFWSFAGPCQSFNRNCARIKNKDGVEENTPYEEVHGEIKFDLFISSCAFQACRNRISI